MSGTLVACGVGAGSADGFSVSEGFFVGAGVGVFQSQSHPPHGLLGFLVGSGVGDGLGSIVKTFSKVNNVEIPYQIKPRRAGDIAECYADPTKAKEVLGWTAEKTLEDMCRDSWNWQKNNPKGYEE